VDLNDTLLQYIAASGNTAGALIILYWFVDTIKNWNGSPELKLLKGQLKDTNDNIAQLNKHIETLINKL